MPFLSQKAIDFWSTRLWYFQQGLYFQVSSIVAWARSIA